MLTDTHCHLNLHHFAEDLEEVIQRAQDAGIQRILVPGTDVETSRIAIDLAQKFPQVYAAIGVHPSETSDWDGSAIETLRTLAQQPKVMAIGEIGLDYYRDYSPRDRQIEAFTAQLSLAADLGKPVVLHNRQATEDTLSIVREWLHVHPTSNGRSPGVFHSFSEDPAIAHQVIELGFFIGISGPVTYPKSAGLQEVVQSIPADRLLVETDAPYLPPQPYRGRRNEPSYVRITAERIASILSLDPQVLFDRTSQNANHLFNWGL